ncbi:unnamed protein product [Blepharisma stoltei]|uniref:Hyaluronan/mRNA-binding protein domain-containing protein n=1 Tax=Blepharisma stoltei TaxID=1481888 RepID=A0AAU9J1R1_9CILI|nr:unnamed protein product [Blepharisma stoltei]
MTKSKWCKIQEFMMAIKNMFWGTVITEHKVRSGNIFSLLDDDTEEASKTKPEAKKGTFNSEKQTGQASKSEIHSKQAKDTKKTPSQPKPQQPIAPIPDSKESKTIEKSRREAPSDDRKQRQAYRGKDAKKEGAGGHNWGKPTDLPQEEPKEEVEAKPEDEGKKEEVTAEEAVEEKPKENFITLDEYFGTAKQEEEEKTEEAPKDEYLRFRINKGIRRKQGGYNKKGEGEQEQGKGERGERKERGERGERGERAERGEKREYKGQRKNAPPPPNFADANAFPALA